MKSREKARLEKLYKEVLAPALQKELQLKNIMQVPKISKIVLNIGVKEAVADKKILQGVRNILSTIAGQAAVETIAKKSIAGFKIRQGMPLGTKVTLRGKRMYEFLDQLINLALPTVRDFRGIPVKFDRRGNYNLGIKEWVVFPGVDYDTFSKVFGLNISIETTTTNDKHAYALLKSFRMPFVRETKLG
ncbi:50S ribosomal protein L5 [Candidatus Dependentiae bacterium]|nr:50S ribosomal protein L5 [Candidatus Dependentiae bacterium]